MNTTPELSYKSFGSGNKHIIFLHGYCEVKEMWDDFIPTFSELYDTHTFLSIDLPGFGKSEISDDVESLLDIAEALAAFIKSLNINSAIWFGHSLGGYILMNLLKRNPELIDGMCLFHSSIFADSEEKKEQRDKTMDFIRDHGKEAFINNFIPNLFYSSRKKFLTKEIDESVRKALQNSESSMLRYMKMMRDREDLSLLLQNNKVPTLFIAGANDTSVPIDISEKQIKLISNSTSLILDDCGHMGMFEYPTDCSESIKRFLSPII